MQSRRFEACRAIIAGDSEGPDHWFDTLCGISYSELKIRKKRLDRMKDTIYIVQYGING
jgi:hypothetical protein